MKCPHCLVDFHVTIDLIGLGSDVEGVWGIETRKCPACGKFIFHLVNGDRIINTTTGKKKVISLHKIIMVRPKGSSRPPCPPEVPPEIAEDYNEACLVLPDSSKASAALSRRCLQNVLIEAAGIKKKNLSDQIDEILSNGKLPTHIEESIDAIRNVGNFSAHPIKSQSTGQIVPVEPEEAEWNLDVLESLFDFYYVQPAKIKAKRDALDEKLKDAGAKPMK